MKLTPWYLAALAPIAVAGCSGALMGHVAVMAVTIAIFVGTLSLGRQTPQEGGALAPTARLLTPPPSKAWVPGAQPPDNA